MNTTVIIALLVAILGILVYVFFFRKEEKENDVQGMLMLQQQLQQLTKTMDVRLSDSSDKMHRSVQSQFRESQDFITRINKEMNERLMHVVKGVAEVSESSKQVFTIADQLNNLEKVLKHQKQRGNLGEASLKLALENILPPGSYTMQYPFKDNAVVDAVIHTPEGLVPIDSKFSLDNYERLIAAQTDAEREQYERDFIKDLRVRIDETAKYIRPKEGTLPFAFMYIPAEGIYYDLMVNEVGAVKVNTRSLLEYAYKDKNVIIVSPTTFSAYLQSVLYGFRAFKIEESAKQIGKHVEALSRHLKAYEDYTSKLGKSLETTVNHYNSAQKEFGKIDKDVMKITGTAMDSEALLIEKPTRMESDDE
ncbi:hypothetical protein A3C87_03440 [Candidatus Kaiserbacteria bacterium RIFCSPHIGHO2_02_FULL_49_34]|uniref:DNA recombination protein RmuC n=1 Tax=Candidatus Kaiserbacteria bacterium RIFCSPHIGHO2_02_FULL_49_34 TaxID=1798491 RepID=A0A1F6DIG5_9BACT|nr:MAG: hypothetical protein A3C87_03440 [Candidatus Kaiserbacteria bacterium RIFCSPHIGHO2_02_FULL_49_34]